MFLFFASITFQNKFHLQNLLAYLKAMIYVFGTTLGKAQVRQINLIKYFTLKQKKNKNKDKLSKLEDRVEGKYSYNICFPKWMFTEIMLQFIFYVCMRMGGFVLGRCVFFLDIKMVFMVLFFLMAALTFFLWKKNNKKFRFCDYISNQMTITF